MAAQAWSLYNKGKHYISGTIALGSSTCNMLLATSASNFATFTISTLGSLTNKVASAHGYKTSGKAMTKAWSTGASAKQQAFTANALTWTASGGAISAIKAAVIVAVTGASAKDSANKLLCFASLSSGQFSISSGNTLTITPAATGVFTLT